LIEDRQAKALVVACNTATSAAVRLLREKFAVPIVGMEPALKPAVARAHGKTVLVMATPMTLREEKFQSLIARYGQGASIISLPCPGLVELIEAGKTEGPEMHAYLREIFASVDTSQVGVVVLGCTHYIFARRAIAAFFSADTPVIDGNEGTARQLKRVLEMNGLRNAGAPAVPEPVEWFTSGSPEALEKLRAFWRK
ncbi:MAG TPA: glutamate racemase, partial [Clostridia bacterium]|nr:glutamate racemase [Clostridia bacterium]